MEVINLEEVVNDESIETTEVLLGADGISQTDLEEFVGEDGLVKEEMFEIYRLRLTRECLQDLIRWNHSGIEYIEHPGDDGVVGLYNTENNPLDPESFF